MARNIYPGYCYCCGEYVEPGYGHFERNNGKWRIKCVKCTSGRKLKDNDNGVLWAQQEAKRMEEEVQKHGPQVYARIRKGKAICQKLFDNLWQGKPKPFKIQNSLYCWLAKKMGIKINNCDFNRFSLEQLIQVYKILSEVQEKQILHDKNCNLYFAE